MDVSLDRPPFLLPRPDLGVWRAGNTGTAGVWRFESGVPGRRVLVTALVHGNELCGAWALKAALDAGLRPRRGSLTLAFCNLAAFDRFDAAAFDASRCIDEDLNRVWGAMPWRGAPASVEQRRALELLPHAESSDWLLDLHSMQDRGPPLVLTGLAPRHVALARHIGAPALVVADAGHRAGRRLRDHGCWGEALDRADDDSRALLVECGFHGDLAARDVALDALARFLVGAATVDDGDLPASWQQPLPPAQTVVQVTEAVTCAEGVPPRFAQPWHSGQRVARAGTLLGWNGGVPFVTPYADCTLIMPSLRHARPGVTLVRLGRDAPTG